MIVFIVRVSQQFDALHVILFPFFSLQYKTNSAQGLLVKNIHGVVAVIVPIVGIIGGAIRQRD